ncbi:MAG TPA: hypothetical protein VGC00_12295 [Thermoanaerobaculia bacterium]
MGISASKRRSTAAWLALALLLAVTAAAFAHEGHHHEAMGTVKLIHEEHLVLTLADGKEQTFVLSETTKFVRGKEVATKGDVVAGDRAVVMYEKKDGADHALEVKLGEKKS